jgi:hypothetical protein
VELDDVRVGEFAHYPGLVHEFLYLLFCAFVQRGFLDCDIDFFSILLRMDSFANNAERATAQFAPSFD